MVGRDADRGCLGELPCRAAEEQKREAPPCAVAADRSSMRSAARDRYSPRVHSLASVIVSPKGLRRGHLDADRPFLGRAAALALNRSLRPTTCGTQLLRCRSLRALLRTRSRLGGRTLLGFRRPRPHGHLLPGSAERVNAALDALASRVVRARRPRRSRRIAHVVRKRPMAPGNALRAGPIEWALADSNRRPQPCEGCALTT